MTFVEPAWPSDNSTHNTFTFASTNPGTPWHIAHGVLSRDNTIAIDYGCGKGIPCQVCCICLFDDECRLRGVYLVLKYL